MSWPQILVVFVLGFGLGAFWQAKRMGRIHRIQFLHLTAFVKGAVDQVIDKDQALYAGCSGDKTGSLGESHPIEPTRRRERTNVAGVKSIEPSFLNRKQEGTRGGANDSPEAA